MSAISTSPTSGNHRKRQRMSFACNSCRSRKIKCDDQQPACKNCVKAGTECVTTDPRQHGQYAHRRRVHYRDTLSPNDSIETRNEVVVPADHPTQSSSEHHQTSRQTSASDFPQPHTQVYEENIPPAAGSEENAPLPILPRFVAGNSLQVLTQWLDLAFARIGLPQRFSLPYNIDRLASRSSKVSPLLQIPESPVLLNSGVENLAQSFNNCVNLVYPIFDPQAVCDMLGEYATISSRGDSLREMSSSSAIAMLIGGIVRCQNPTEDGLTALDYIRAAYSLLSTIIAEASLRSTQALFLMALVLRNYNEIEMAWHLLHTAVSVSQSLGMHRSISVQRRTRLGEALSEEYVRTWWALYSLEKLLSLEIERHSSIRDSECNQSLPLLTQNPPLFESIIKLAQVQSQINERCILARISEENDTLDYQDVIREKLVNAGELDHMLVSWEEALVSDIRPSNYLYCDPKLLLGVCFMATQYHQTLVQLHRNTLIVNVQIALKEVKLFCGDKPYVHRLLKAQTICGNAARSIVSVLETAYEHEACSVLNSITAPLIAVYAIGIHTLKYPSSRLAKADLELQVRAIEFVKQQQEHRQLRDYDTRLEALLDALKDQVVIKVSGATSAVKEKANRSPIESTVPAASARNIENLESNHFQTNLQPWDQSISSTQELQWYNLDSNDSNAQIMHDPVRDPGFYDPAYLYWNGTLNSAETDWDAIALAFDLP